MDMQKLQISGIEIARRVLALKPDAKVRIMTANEVTEQMLS
jgi:DNA-binding NarL/FixJ family response regulator